MQVHYSSAKQRVKPISEKILYTNRIKITLRRTRSILLLYVFKTRISRNIILSNDIHLNKTYARYDWSIDQHKQMHGIKKLSKGFNNTVRCISHQREIYRSAG